MPGRETGGPDEVSVASERAGGEAHQGHVIGDAVLVIVRVRDELRGVDDLAAVLRVVQVVRPEVDIRAHGTESKSRV